MRKPPFEEGLAWRLARRFDADFPPARRGICSVQDDLSVANAAGATVRADINNQLQSLGTLMSGTSEPGTKYAGMFWHDTSALVVKQRNASNSAWIVRWTVANAEGVFAPVIAAMLGVDIQGGTFASGRLYFSGNVLAIGGGSAGFKTVNAAGTLSTFTVSDAGNLASPGTVLLGAAPVANTGDSVLSIGASAKGSTARLQRNTQNVSTSASILTCAYQSAGGGMAIVHGREGANIFVDIVCYSAAGGNYAVVSSATLNGAPPARTYSCDGTSLLLAMASGTYDINCSALESNSPV